MTVKNAETVLTDDSRSRRQRRGSGVWEQWYDICAPSDVSSSIIIIIIIIIVMMMLILL